ncbi:glutamate carboxypeptidase 2-like, partial [Strongylocentrotus purpuratus]|uniref:PA domain-containing protein n=1 Tax=Strongylocentrotus purpuratus TaxID=7668 RepID=A0A7M7NMR0_STRPU
KLTSTPHLAGTPADKSNADYVRDEWIKYGLEPVRQNAYNVLLSYPSKEIPTMYQCLTVTTPSSFNHKLKRPPLDVGTLSNDTVRPFNAYAANGTVQGDLVYVNYGRVEDFQLLEGSLNMNVTGKIAVARYGRSSEGTRLSKLKHFGAIGLILYSDPADYAVDGISSVYPDSWWLPGSGSSGGLCIFNKASGVTP